MKKQKLSKDLHISHFIKQPENLKLLILAGTEVQKSEFQTIRRCINLIKLDLSNNNLKLIPIPLEKFVSLKILYLHDNQFDTFESINVKGSSAEFITLFNNPIKNYRRYLLNNLKQLKGIDKNIVTQKQKNGYVQQKYFQQCTEIKWPLVQVDKQLQNQNDYLNLLKGELLILNDTYTKTLYYNRIQIYLLSFASQNNIRSQLLMISQKNQRKHNMTVKVIKQWRFYTSKRVKLRQHLKSIGKQYLIANRVQYKKYLRGDQTNRVIANYMKYIRSRVLARKLLKKNIMNFNTKIKQRKQQDNLLEAPHRFYIKQSQQAILNKIFLYIKKILFNMKKYELCEEFDKEMHRTGKHYIIVKSKCIYQKDSQLMQKVSMMMNSIIIQDYNKRKLKLYNNKGHIKIINLESSQHYFDEDDRLKMLIVSENLQIKYKSYDRLIEWETMNTEIFLLMNKLIRYYNSGNTTKILTNTTAYFQTQIPSQETDAKIYQKIYIFTENMLQRSVSAVKIQSFWRRCLAQKKINLVYIINKSKAAKKIQRWMRNIKFIHRNRFTQKFVFYEKTLTHSVYYIQLFVYMNLPKITNVLNFNLLRPSKFLPYERITQFCDLYQLLHRETKIRTLTINDQSWIKIEFQSIKQATKRLKLLSVFTYKLLLSSSIRLFTFEQCSQTKEDYEQSICFLYQINPDTRYTKIKNKRIDNNSSIFLYEKGKTQPLSKINSIILKPKITQFKISIFVFNQGRKGLKVDSKLCILSINNLYFQNSCVPPFIQSQSFIPQQPRYSIPLLLQQMSRTKKLMPLRQIRHSKQPSFRQQYQNRHKTRSVIRSAKDESNVAIGSLKLISQTMPFKRK